MWSERLATVAAVMLLLAGGAGAWMVQLRDRLAPEPASLSALPYELESFRGLDTPVDETVEEMLRADYNVQREYVHPLGQVVWMYVGYYGTERGGTPEHTPRACYLAHGWQIVEETELVTDPASGHTAKEYLVELRGQQQLVLYWYRSFRKSGMVSTFALGVDHVLGKLLAGRGDGALVRLSTPLVGSDRAAARAVLLSFARALEPALAPVWPAEAPAGPSRSAEAAR